MLRALTQKLSPVWRMTLLVFLALRAADLVNAFIGIWLVPRYIPADQLGAVLPLTQAASFLALPLSILLIPYTKLLNLHSERGEHGQARALLRDAALLTGGAFLLILAVSAVLSQVTPLAVGYLTDSVLTSETIAISSVIPILLVILLVNVVNEVIMVVRRLIVENTATQTEKTARQKAADSLLLAPLSYFREHMTGNIHGRLNRSLEGTVKLIKLLFMDFAPAITTGLAAIVTIFVQLPAGVACLVILVIPIGTFLVFRQISTQKGIRVELLETKAEMDGTVVELLGGIETIRALDSA